MEFNSPSRKKVFVISDHADLARYVGQLTQLHGFGESGIFGFGNEAILALQEEKPACVVFILEPVEFKEKEFRAIFGSSSDILNVPIIVCSRDVKGMRKIMDTMRLSVDAFFPRPFKEEAFIDLVRYATRTTAIQTPATSQRNQ